MTASDGGMKTGGGNGSDRKIRKKQLRASIGARL